MADFVDRVTLHLAAGRGGRGCASVRREKFKPLGGPDGGNGGNGGSILFEVDKQVTTLLGLRRGPHLVASNGQDGSGANHDGAAGTDLVVTVPVGTVVKDLDGNVLADLVSPGSRFVAAQGGRGGLGNAALASVKRKAPGFALLGELGQCHDLVVELKLLADVALVGFPSAGKSSLIAAMSAARPKIADYPFTTLIPNLGVVQAGAQKFTMADVPGLIPGAATGRGLGLDFLRHIERSSVVVHVLDCATYESGRDPLSDLQTIESELAQYAGDWQLVGDCVPLADRPRLIVLNKIDVPEARDLAELVRADLAAFGWPVHLVSAVSHEGLPALGYALAGLVDQARQAAQQFEQARPAPIIRPKAVDAAEFTVTRHGAAALGAALQQVGGAPASHRSGDQTVFQIRGSKPERWVQQTDFSNDEAVGYLADRLEQLGVEAALREAGAQAGATVVIGALDGGVVFDWEPSLSTGPELLAARGQDVRLASTQRRTNAERRREYTQWMDAKAAARQELWTQRQAGHWVDPADGSAPAEQP